MENFTSNINKPNLQYYNINNLNFIEEEYVSDFNNINNDKYIKLDDINEDLDDLISEDDIFEDNNTGLNTEEYLNNPNFFQLNMDAFQSARQLSTTLNETDNIDDFILELDSNFDDESVVSMATDITNEVQLIEISEPTKLTKFTTCVLIDNFNGEIRSCGSSQNLHCVKNIFGTWEIDSEMVHRLHVKNAKGTKDSFLGFISNRRCLFCNINKTFYTREEQCDQYSWTLVGQNLQVPCCGQYHCTSLTEICLILYPSLSNKKAHYICTSCYEKHANWLLYVAEYESPNFQEQLSPAFKLNKLDFFNCEYKKFSEKESFEFGQEMAKTILKNRKNINNNKKLFENPDSLIEYYNAFSLLLSEFFLGLVNTLQLSKFKEVNRKKQFHGKLTTSFDPNSTIKTRIFLMSIIFRIAFPSLQLWLSTMLTSLIRKPKLITLLQQLLITIHAIAHTQKHERKLENRRIMTANPCERLWVGDNIWNIGVIDNIDFKEKTFTYSNIFDQIRNITHATLCIVFQYKMLNSISALLSNVFPISNISTLKLWGDNIKSQQFILNFHQIFKDFLQFSGSGNFFKYSQNFDLPDIYQQIINSTELGCQLPPANVVILEAGNKPSSNEEIFEACDMFLQDFSLDNNKYIDIVSDEAIFRRTIHYIETHAYTRIILGQWHTSKDMCSVLITIFSGFGNFNLAAALETKFLDKLEAVVDYQSTCRVLEMIWFVVEVAIHIHLKKHNKTIKQIIDENNNLLKTCYFFLAHLAKHPELKELLKHACLINIIREKHFFAFDEALETFGVKYVKQNISGNPINTEQLKNQIKAVQSERDQINLFLFEFLDDNVAYQVGEECLNAILKQDVLKSEKRVAIGVMTEEQNVLSQSNPNAEIQSLPNNTQITHSPSDLIENPCPTKCVKRTTHAQELPFLEPLVNNISEENINNAIQQLNN
ncbi:hypothetical protein C1645_824334 [Glomus cerebriforme]|uniref:Uncharacterized protein n=1 Tax=Glomus cerebriforme TaxID=658196 RepID=A0A397SUM9_9GLOM|nr:hypothetical protein C1645_824334 [Glomus cerebriforme]